MISSDTAPSLAVKTDSKIVLVVIDGLGGFPNDSGKTELETAATPNLDKLAAEGLTGRIQTLGRGITPGSGLAHLALFGYDAFVHDIGRGAIAANGIGKTLAPNQVAARLNFCTEEAGTITDRRAGRIPTDKCAELCELVNGALDVPGVKIELSPVMDYRAVVVFESEGLNINVGDTDPGDVGKPPKPVEATGDGADKMVGVVKEFLAQAKKALADQHPANSVLLRGFAVQPDFPSMQECYRLTPACIATYPDYRGVGRIIGMEILSTGKEIADEFDTLEEKWDDFDFFFLHVKKTDSLGEDGDFDGRVHKLEELDAQIPRLAALNPEVIAVTGDHSTPAVFKSHTWHPVPVLIKSPNAIVDGVSSFGERACVGGGLGLLPGAELMLEILGHAGKLKKMGA